MTLRRKIDRLRSRKVLDDGQHRILIDLNRIRNRFLHPKKHVSHLTTARSGLRALRLLHDFVETTHGVMQDYEIENGILVPRRFKTGEA